MKRHTSYTPMKRIVSVLAMLFCVVALAQAQEQVTPEGTWKFMEVSGNNYHGYAFPADWDVDVTVEGQDGRYTPDDADIAKAEHLIQKRIAYLNRNHENQEGMTPLIDENMNKYERQYVGFTDMNGFRIIWVNFIWDASLQGKLGRDVVRTEGGSSHYWSVKVNLDTEKVYGLEVNAAGNVKYLPREKKPGPRISKPKNDKEQQGVRKTGIIHKASEKTF